MLPEKGGITVSEYNITSHWVPNVKELRKFVKILEGVNMRTLKGLHDQIWEATGSPQEPRDWREPARWIRELYRDKTLNTDTKRLAETIAQSGLNPRHWNYGHARVAVRHGFLKKKAGKYVLTEQGKKFAKGDDKVLHAYLFENGILRVLEFLNEETGLPREELVQRWRDFINREGGKNVKARSVLREGVFSRIDNVLIPLGLVRKEGIPRRYFITAKGRATIEELRIETAGPDKKEKTKHQIAIDNILDIGRRLGYLSQPHPKLRHVLPRERQPLLKRGVYDKELDALWTTNLPLVGEIRIPVEVQVKGGITDLLFRLKTIAPYAHFMIVISDRQQIEEIDEHIEAQGETKTFVDKIIYLTFEEVSAIRSQVSNISSKLKPSYVEQDGEESLDEEKEE